MKLGSYQLTPIGAILLVLLAGAVGAATVGPAGLQGPALVIALLLAAFLAIGGFPGGMRGNMSLSERRATYGPESPDESNGEVDPHEQDEAWQRERERRQRAGR